MAFGAHFFRTVVKSKVSINLYCHQSGLHTLVAFETHFVGAVVGDQCFTLQDGFQRPLPFFCLTFSVGSKSIGAALSGPLYLSKQATYPCVRFGTHISPEQQETSLYGIQECWGSLIRLTLSIQLGLHTLCSILDPHLSWITQVPTSTILKSAGTSLYIITHPTGPNGVTHPCGI